MFKPKPGDILDPSGDIFVEAGKVIARGVVIIHRSRLRRARRFGWVDAPPHIVPSEQVAPHLIAVARA